MQNKLYLAIAITALIIATLACGSSNTGGTPRPVTPMPTATRTLLTMGMSEYTSAYEGMTDLQRSNFWQETVDQWIDWTGAIGEVSDNGTISLFPSNGIVHLEGVPLEVAASLSKGQAIRFTGRLDKISFFMFLTVTVREVQIVP